MTAEQLEEFVLGLLSGKVTTVPLQVGPSRAAQRSAHRGRVAGRRRQLSLGGACVLNWKVGDVQLLRQLSFKGMLESRWMCTLASLPLPALVGSQQAPGTPPRVPT